MGDWKNEKAEMEMKRSEKEMMEKAVLRKKQEEDQKWEKIKESLYTGDSEDAKNIRWIIDTLREHYELPIERKK